MVKPDDFIEHLRYLLELHPKGRCRKKEWREMKKLLKEYGYWKQPHNFTSFSTRRTMQKQAERLNVVKNANYTTSDDLGTSMFDNEGDYIE